MRDYSQDGDPYGIAVAYTSQSADDGLVASREVRVAGVDVRGNSLSVPRSLPTQAEAPPSSTCPLSGCLWEWAFLCLNGDDGKEDNDTDAGLAGGLRRV